MSIAIALTLHLIAINVWVGGMFFVVVVMSRVIATLEPFQGLVIWHKTLAGFFALVWLAMLVLLLTGSWMIQRMYGGLGNAPLYILLMTLLALLMMTVFIFTFFVPYRHFKQALQAQDFETCQRKLETVRLLGKLNMLIGLCVVMIIGAGPHYLV
jgi:uncharacterized membrane protein